MFVLKNNLQAAEPKFTGKMISNATIESHKSDSTLLPAYTLQEREYITNFDPATGYHLGTYMADSVEDIERKIQKVSVAQKEWRRTTFADRRRVVRSLKKWLVEHQEVCARTACRDTGKTREYLYCLDFMRLTTARACSYRRCTGRDPDNMFEDGLANSTWRALSATTDEKNQPHAQL